MDNYTSVAIEKIQQSTNHENFKKVITKNARYSILEFKASVCKVTDLGCVTWS